VMVMVMMNYVSRQEDFRELVAVIWEACILVNPKP